MIPELLTEKEAAAKLNVTPGTLSVWRSTRRYPLRYVRIGRKIRYRVQDLIDFIEGRAMPGDGSQRRRGSAKGTRRGSR